MPKLTNIKDRNGTHSVDLSKVSYVGPVTINPTGHYYSVIVDGVFLYPGMQFDFEDDANASRFQLMGKLNSQ